MGATYSGSSTTGGSTSVTTSVTQATGAVNAQTQQNYNKYNQDYKQSNEVTQAYNNLQNVLNAKPGEFQSQYSAQLEKLYGQIMNRPAFSYNMNTDAIYNMYKDQYQMQGKRAMQDTIGQASTLTGGYGNSYAQTAGQQQYQNYLTQLNNMVPQLYQMARDSYDAEGNRLNQLYGVASDAYNRDYSQYRDKVSDWQSDRAYAQGAYQDARDFDWSQYSANRTYWQSEYWNQKNSAHTTTSTTNTTSWSNTSSWSYTEPSGGSGGESDGKKPTTSSSYTPSLGNVIVPGKQGYSLDKTAAVLKERHQQNAAKSAK